MRDETKPTSRRGDRRSEGERQATRRDSRSEGIRLRSVAHEGAGNGDDRDAEAVLAAHQPPLSFSLPEGTIQVASALNIAGVATYIFFKLGTWAVGDDTVDEHRGQKVPGKARHRDPVRSSHAYTAGRYGPKGVVLAVLLPFPFARRPWALPRLVAWYRSAEDNRRRGHPHQTPSALLRVRLQRRLRWFADRSFGFAGDSGLGNHAWAAFARRQGGRLTLVSSSHPSMASGFLLGFAFAFGWTPCIGPILAGVLAMAATSDTIMQGVFLLVIYSAGLAIPFLLTAAGINRFLRFYKNFRRWRESGWQRAMDDMGVSDAMIQRLCDQEEQYPQQFNAEAERILRVAQAHYRKSEPDHSRCLSAREWEQMYREGYGFEYRIWHLAQCLDCLCTVWDFGFGTGGSGDKPKTIFHVRP